MTISAIPDGIVAGTHDTEDLPWETSPPWQAIRKVDTMKNHHQHNHIARRMRHSIEQYDKTPSVVLMHSVREPGEVKPPMFATVTSEAIVARNVRHWRRDTEIWKARRAVKGGAR